MHQRQTWALWRGSAAKFQLHGGNVLQGRSLKVMQQLASMHGIETARGSVNEAVASIAPILEEHFGSVEYAQEM